MNPDIKVRFINPDDMHFVLTAYTALCRDEDKQESAKRYINLTFNEIFKYGTASAWVAEIENEIAGVFILKLDNHPFETPSEYAVADIMYIKKKFRNMGVAEKIIERVFPLFMKSGIRRLQLFLKDENKKYNEMIEKKFLKGIKKVHTVYEWRKTGEKEDTL